MADKNLPGNTGTVCIMGLSSSGKSTLARLVVARLRENGYACALIDGDEVRNLFEERYGYDPDSRRAQSRRLLRLATWLQGQEIIPVLAMIHPFEDDRVVFRESLRNYYQVHLDCDLEECARRDRDLDKGVYTLKDQSESPNVVGIDIPFDPVDSADLVLDSKSQTPEEILETLWDNMQRMFLITSDAEDLPAAAMG